MRNFVPTPIFIMTMLAASLASAQTANDAYYAALSNGIYEVNAKTGQEALLNGADSYEYEDHRGIAVNRALGRAYQGTQYLESERSFIRVWDVTTRAEVDRINLPTGVPLPDDITIAPNGNLFFIVGITDPDTSLIADGAVYQVVPATHAVTLICGTNPVSDTAAGSGVALKGGGALTALTDTTLVVSFIKTAGPTPVYTLGSIVTGTGTCTEFAGKSGTRYLSLATETSTSALGLKSIPADPQSDFGLYRVSDIGTEVLAEELNEISGSASDPLEVAFDGTSAVVIGGTFPEIVEVNMTTFAVSNYSVSYPYPSEKNDMDLTAAGDLIVSFNTANPLAIITRVTGNGEIFAPRPGLGTGEIPRNPRPGKMAFRSSGQLIVETNDQSFWSYNLSSGVRGLFSGPHYGSPWVTGISGGMTADVAGNVFTTGGTFSSPYPGLEKILAMDSAGVVTQLGADLAGDTRALVYSAGFIYAMAARHEATGSSTLYRYNSTTGARTVAATTSLLYYPTEMKVMPNGNILIAHNEIYADTFPFDTLGETGLTVYNTVAGTFSTIVTKNNITGPFPNWIDGVAVDSNTVFSLVVGDPYDNLNSGIYRIDQTAGTSVRVSPEKTSRLFGSSLIPTAANKTLLPVAVPVTSISTGGEFDFGHTGVRMSFSRIDTPGTVTITPIYTAPANLSPALGMHWSITGLPAGSFDAQIVFEYNDVLLAESGITEANLGLYRSTDNGASWIHVPEVLDGSLDQVSTGAPQSGFSLWAVAELGTSSAGDIWQLYN